MPDRVKEKLVELLKKAKAKEQYDFLFGDIDTAIDMPHGAEYYADFLVANGVTVNGEKYKEIDEFIESRVLDGKEYPTAKLYYEDYQKELERLYNGVTVQEWISVKDRLPMMAEVGEFVLVYTHEDKHIIATCWAVHKHKDQIIAWMPLPQPPKGE